MSVTMCKVCYILLVGLHFLQMVIFIKKLDFYRNRESQHFYGFLSRYKEILIFSLFLIFNLLRDLVAN